MAKKGMVGETTSLLMDTGKAAVIGSVLRAIGNRLGGPIGDGIGACVAGAIVKGNMGSTVALIGVMDAVHNFTGSGGAAMGRKQTPSRREL